jgi:hypothetical protein
MITIIFHQKIQFSLKNMGVDPDWTQIQQGLGLDSAEELRRNILRFVATFFTCDFCLNFQCYNSLVWIQTSK